MKSMWTWVYFFASTKEASLKHLTDSITGNLSFYSIQEVIPVKGEVPTNLARCSNAVRIESSARLSISEEFPAGSSIIQFQSVTQHLQYTSDGQLRELNRRSIPELESSEHTMAVLIPIGKSEEWWKLAQDRRQVYFQKTGKSDGHIAIGLKYVDRVFRMLYHSHCLDTAPSYDFLTYFEFEDVCEADFRTLLAELRCTKEWNFVNFELEIWMTKILQR